MHQRNILAGGLILLVLAGAALAADVTGAWSGNASMGDNQFTLTYNFKQDGAKLTGNVISPQGDTIPLIEGKVDGDRISFAVKVDMNGSTAKFISAGTVKGEEIAITTTAESGSDFPPISMTLKRSK